MLVSPLHVSVPPQNVPDHFEGAMIPTERIPWWWHLGRTETCSGHADIRCVYILVLVNLALQVNFYIKHGTYNILKQTKNDFITSQEFLNELSDCLILGTEPISKTLRCLWSSWSRLEIQLHQLVPLYYKHIADKEFLIKVAAFLMVNNSRLTQFVVCAQSRSISVRGRRCFQHLEFVRNPRAVSKSCSKNYPG